MSSPSARAIIALCACYVEEHTILSPHKNTTRISTLFLQTFIYTHPSNNLSHTARLLPCSSIGKYLNRCTMFLLEYATTTTAHDTHNSTSSQRPSCRDQNAITYQTIPRAIMQGILQLQASSIPIQPINLKDITMLINYLKFYSQQCLIAYALERTIVLNSQCAYRDQRRQKSDAQAIIYLQHAYKHSLSNQVFFYTCSSAMHRTPICFHLPHLLENHTRQNEYLKQISNAFGQRH